MGRKRNYQDTICETCRKKFYRRTHGYSTKPKYCSSSCYLKSKDFGGFKKGHKTNVGRKYGVETRRKRSLALMGHEVKPKTLEKIKHTLFKNGDVPWNKGNNNPSPTRKLRSNGKYKKWVKDVKDRDGWTCIFCGSTKNIHADHIKPILTHPKLTYVVSNGRTLCKKCHIKTDTYGGKRKNNV